MAERVHAGVRGQLARHRGQDLGIGQRDIGHERAAADRRLELTLGVGHHAELRHVGTRAPGGGNHDHRRDRARRAVNPLVVEDLTAVAAEDRHSLGQVDAASAADRQQRVTPALQVALERRLDLHVLGVRGQVVPHARVDVDVGQMRHGPLNPAGGQHTRVADQHRAPAADSPNRSPNFRQRADAEDDLGDQELTHATRESETRGTMPAGGAAGMEVACCTPSLLTRIRRRSYRRNAARGPGARLECRRIQLQLVVLCRL